jgi:hypothetical protein
VDGSLTVSHLDGHGQITLPVDYVRAHVRLGYAATVHGYEGDTVDVSLGVATEATSLRALYVALTRGRQDNRLLVVADDLDHTRDVLEQVLTNNRTDIPAVAQRRNLAGRAPRARPANDPVATARRALREIERRAGPYLEGLDQAQQGVQAADADLRAQRHELERSAPWRRRGAHDLVARASQRFTAAEARLEDAEKVAAPYLRALNAADGRLQEAHHGATVASIQQRLDNLTLRAPARAAERDLGIDLPGL